jgi:hypothetical protein
MSLPGVSVASCPRPPHSLPPHRIRVDDRLALQREPGNSEDLSDGAPAVILAAALAL